MQVIKLTSDGFVDVVELDDKHLVRDIDDMIGGFEIVRTRELYAFFGCNVVMVVDDNFFAHCKPYNCIASEFYPGDICGDVLFIYEQYGEFAPFPYPVDDLLMKFSFLYW